jgi:predicted tellurium resistance membrane protein TerC
MHLLYEPQVWLSFLTLLMLEIVLGIDNIIFLVVLVERLPHPRRRSAQFLGLTFAMLTRIGLLFSISWLTTLRTPLFALLGETVSARDLILFAGGAFLVVQSTIDILEVFKGKEAPQKRKVLDGFWMIILQIGIIDIVFSLDSIFAAIGLVKLLWVMVAAIVCSVLVMMWVSTAVGRYVERNPTIKVLALAFLILIGAAMIADSAHREIPPGYLYFAMAFAVAVEMINLRVRRRSDLRSK